MRARQRPTASAAESNWILQEVKMIQLRSCWSSCSAFVFPFDIVTTRCFSRHCQIDFSKPAREPRWHTDCFPVSSGIK